MRGAVLIGTLAAAACADDGLQRSSSETPSPCDNLAFGVQPGRLARGEATEVVVTWQGQLDGDVGATLRLEADDVIEVDLPLALTVDHLWEGRLLNPFGPGAPAGSVAVLGRAGGDLCEGRTAPATSFYLE
jgi:hypothetical protein